jgi:hypothetical protein
MTSPVFVLLFSIAIFIVFFAIYTYFMYLLQKMAANSSLSKKK